MSQEEIKAAKFLALPIRDTGLNLQQTEKYSLDLTGIQYLEALTRVNVSVYDEVKGMEKLLNLKNLRNLEFKCEKSDFPNDVKSDSLKKLDISNVNKNVASALHGMTNLERLDIVSGSVKTLDLRDNKNLRILNCRISGLKKLDISKNKKLKRLEIGEGALKRLDLSANKQLESLGCFEDSLRKVDVRKLHHLTSIMVRGKRVKKLLLNEEVKQLTISMTQIEILSLKNCKKIRTLNCCDNPKLRQIKHLQNVKQLRSFDAGHVITKKSKLTNLDLKYNTKLESIVLNYSRGELKKLSLPENYLEMCDDEWTSSDSNEGGDHLFRVFLGQHCQVKILDLRAVKKLSRERWRLLKYWIRQDSVKKVIISRDMSPKLCQYVKKQCKRNSCKLQYVIH